MNRSLSTLSFAVLVAALGAGCGHIESSDTDQALPCEDVVLPVSSSLSSSSSDRERLGQVGLDDGLSTSEAAITASAAPESESEELDVLVTLADDTVQPSLMRDARFQPLQQGPLSVARRGSQRQEFTARLSPEQIQELRRDPSVLRVEEDRPVYAMGFTEANSVEASAVTATEEIPWGVARVGASAYWDANGDGLFDPGAATGQGIRVCVIDTGIDPTHPELRDIYRGGFDFVDDDSDPTDATGVVRGSGHGTHVAATIAAQLGSSGNGSDELAPNGVVGIAPGIELFSVRVLDTDGAGKTSDTINAIRWCAENRMHIATLSLGSKDPSDTEKAAFDEAYNSGMLILAASGNGGNEKSVAYPAGYDSVIAVGATDARDQLARFSQTGPAMELVAPGVSILSATMVNGGVVPTLNVAGQDLPASAMSGPGLVEDEVISCGFGDSLHSCAQIRCGGFVAYVERGGAVKFSEKVRNVMAQGASAVIIANNAADYPNDAGRFTLGAGGPWPPVVSISYASAQTLTEQLGEGVRARVDLRGIDYARMSGTSMATPHATGVAALVWSASPELTNRGVRALLQQTAIDLGAEGRDDEYGFGLVQVSRP